VVNKDFHNASNKRGNSNRLSHFGAFCIDGAGAETGRRPSSQVVNVSASLQLRSRLRRVDAAPGDWRLPCTDTARLVHQLTPPWPRVYAEYHADAPLHPAVRPHPVAGHRADRSTATTLCLERRFHWTGFVEAHVRREELPAEVVPACAPEVDNLAVGMNATKAVYLALHGSFESLVGALSCIPLERLPVYVVTVECRDDVTSGRAEAASGKSSRARLGLLSRAAIDQQRCKDVMVGRAWRLHATTRQDFVYVRPLRRRDVIRRRRHTSRDSRGLTLDY